MFYIIDPDICYLEVDEIDFEQVNCPKCGPYPGPRKGGVSLVMTRRNEAVPVIRTFDRLAFSEYAIRVFREAGITGWKPLPEKVKIIRRQGAGRVKIPTYHEIIVTGRAGHVRQYPGIKLDEHCPECGRKSYSDFIGGVTVEMRLWDGSDIFKIEQFPGYLVTEKFVEVVRNKKMRGLEFIPAEEWRDPFPES